MAIRCAYCGGTDSPRPCCNQHPNTPMCDRCRAVTRRPDHHRPPIDGIKGPTFHCPRCNRNLRGHNVSWPWANRTRICVTCLWADSHQTDEADS